MLSRNSSLLSIVRLRLFSTSQLRHPTTTRVRQQPNGCCTKRRYLSSDKVDSEVSLEECARSIKKVVSNQQEEEAALGPALELARKLSPEARQEVVRVVASSPEIAAAVAQEGEVPPPTYRDLRLVALAQAIPFLGFGFMDNAILIIAGDAIDTSLGVVLGISTLCAAAIGNIISDVAGIALGTVIEDFCTNYLKLEMPNLTNAQRQLRSVRFASQMGCGVGIVVGCIIGMFPLLFIDSNKIQALKRDAALQGLFEDVMSEAKTLIGAESASLFIVVENDPEQSNDPPKLNPDGRYLYAKYFHSDSGEISHRTFRIGRGIVSRAALTGQAWNIPDVTTEPDYSPEMTGTGNSVRSMCCVPVVDSQGKTIAVIRAFNKIGEGSAGRGDEPKVVQERSSQARRFTDNDVQVLKALASHISVTLQYMYQERDEDAAMGVKDSIRLLKEHGLAGIQEETSPFKRRTPLFPDH